MRRVVYHCAATAPKRQYFFFPPSSLVPAWAWAWGVCSIWEDLLSVRLPSTLSIFLSSSVKMLKDESVSVLLTVQPPTPTPMPHHSLKLRFECQHLDRNIDLRRLKKPGFVFFAKKNERRGKKFEAKNRNRTFVTELNFLDLLERIVWLQLMLRLLFSIPGWKISVLVQVRCFLAAALIAEWANLSKLGKSFCWHNAVKMEDWRKKV